MFQSDLASVVEMLMATDRNALTKSSSLSSSEAQIDGPVEVIWFDSGIFHQTVNV